MHMTTAQATRELFEERSISFVEASMLMDAVEMHAAAGDMFSAGCWWHESAARISEIANSGQREDAARRHREIGERFSAQGF